MDPRGKRGCLPGRLQVCYAQDELLSRRTEERRRVLRVANQDREELVEEGVAGRKSILVIACIERTLYAGNGRYDGDDEMHNGRSADSYDVPRIAIIRGK